MTVAPVGVDPLKEDVELTGPAVVDKGVLVVSLPDVVDCVAVELSVTGKVKVAVELVP